MVLQQNEEVKFWGWGKPGEKISIHPGWTTEITHTSVDNQGNWMVGIKTPPADNKPYEIKIIGYNSIVLSDVLLGEVWFCSGQSNMEWTPRAGIKNLKAIKEANFPSIRLFKVDHRSAETKQIDLEGSWQVSSYENLMDFSAVAFFFGVELNKALDVPVGLILSAWGGTPAEIWTDARYIEKDSLLEAYASMLSPVPWGPVVPGVAYNTMVSPLVNYRIKGSLWYQGEGNVVNGQGYDLLLSTLINCWRDAWGYDFPFYYVQIAPFNYGKPLEGAIVRDNQRKAMAVKNTGMVVVSDIGNIEDIHPKNKKDVGIRLANWALNKTYKKSQNPFSGPIFRKMQLEGDKIRILFDYTEGGLICKGAQLTHFQIAGPDKRFYDAIARIEGETILVELPEAHKGKVKWTSPVAVRFAFSNKAEPNLYNGKGLPASCFRTDDWEIE